MPDLTCWRNGEIIPMKSATDLLKFVGIKLGCYRLNHKARKEDETCIV